MEVGDIVVIPNEGDSYFATIKSPYEYHAELGGQEGFSHWRRVSYFFKKKPIPRRMLPEELRKSLGCQITVFGLSSDDVLRAIEAQRGVVPIDEIRPATVRPPLYEAESILRRIRETRGQPERNMEDIVKEVLLRLGHEPSRVVFQAGRIDVSVRDDSGRIHFIYEVKRDLGSASAIAKARRRAMTMPLRRGRHFS